MYTLADKYYIKAADEYPYSLEDTLENLEYALSYDAEHARANTLMGVLRMESFHDYAGAEEHFCIALGTNPESTETCEYYLRLLLGLKKEKEALRLIAYWEKLPGAEQAKILAARARLQETKKDYAAALTCLHNAMLETCCNDYLDFLKDEKSRIETKLSLIANTGAVIV